MSIQELAARVETLKQTEAEAMKSVVAARTLLATTRQELSAATDALLKEMGVGRGGTRARRSDGRMPTGRFEGNLQRAVEFIKSIGGTGSRIMLEQELGLTKASAGYLIRRLRDQNILQTTQDLGVYTLAGVAQTGEQMPRKHQVGGSTPPAGSEDKRESGRADEGGGLLSRNTGDRIVGSNPTSPANTEIDPEVRAIVDRWNAAGAPEPVRTGVPEAKGNSRLTSNQSAQRAPLTNGISHVPAASRAKEALPSVTPAHQKGLDIQYEIRCDTLLARTLKLLGQKPFMLKELLVTLRCPQPDLYAAIEKARNSGIRIDQNKTGYYVLETRVPGLAA